MLPISNIIYHFILNDIRIIPRTANPTKKDTIKKTHNEQVAFSEKIRLCCVRKCGSLFKN